VQTTMEKNTLKTHEKKMIYKKSPFIHDKFFFYTILIFWILWSTFILVLCSKHISWDHYQTHNMISNLFPLAFNTCNSHIIFTQLQEFTQICTICDLWSQEKKYKGNWIPCIILKCIHHSCFHMSNAKDIFPFSSFALTFVFLLTISWQMLVYIHMKPK
jgi:hypothetical protein